MLSLSKDQWTEELGNRFFSGITREVNSFPFRRPVRSVVELLSLQTDVEYAFHANWKIYGVSIATEISSLFLTALFWGFTAPYIGGTPSHYRR